MLRFLSFENKRSFLSVESLCFIIKELLERNDIPSGIYHVADDEPLSTNELIGIISTAISRKPKFWNVNPRLVQFLAKIGDKLYLPLNSERLTKLTESYVVDNSKIKAALGVNLPVSSGEGLIRTIKSFEF